MQFAAPRASSRSTTMDCSSSMATAVAAAPGTTEPGLRRDVIGVRDEVPTPTLDPSAAVHRFTVEVEDGQDQRLEVDDRCGRPGQERHRARLRRGLHQRRRRVDRVLRDGSRRPVGRRVDGFWFFKGDVGEKADHTFSGAHQDGDILVQVNFTNGGAAPGDIDISKSDNVAVRSRPGRSHGTERCPDQRRLRHRDFNFIIDMSGSIGAAGRIPSNLPRPQGGINGFVNAFRAPAATAATRARGSAAARPRRSRVATSWPRPFHGRGQRA